MSKTWLVWWLALPLFGQVSADEIVRRNREADEQNEKRAARYTYTEETRSFDYDKQGKLKNPKLETHDVIFVEGESYKRLMARDGKPLSPREEAREEKKMHETAEQRRKARRSGLFSHTRTFGISREDIEKLCDRHLLGEEEIGGRKAWVIEFVPQPGRVPANQREKDVLNSLTKNWIDQKDYVTLKGTVTVTGDGTQMKRGTTLSFELANINDDAWLQVSFTFDEPRSIRMETTNSNFKKFDVESTITVEGDKASK